MKELSDEELEKLILAIDNCGHDYGCSCKDFAGTYAEEAWKRYNNKKNECEELRDAHNEVLLELNNKKKECEGLKKLAEQRVRRQVQLHSRNTELKEQIYKAMRALDPSSYRDS